MNHKLTQLLSHSQHPLFFTGAGLSTLSDLPDFTKPQCVIDSNYLPREILTHNFFLKKRNKSLFWKYCDSLHQQINQATPSIGHHYLNKIAKQKPTTIITQNIDGLHAPTQAHLIEIHGNIHTSYCLKCKKQFDYTEMIPTKNNVNRLSPCCNWQAKPNIVLYNETFDSIMTQQYQQAFHRDENMILQNFSRRDRQQH